MCVCVCFVRYLSHTRCTGGGIAKHISLCESEAIFCVYLHMVLGGGVMVVLLRGGKGVKVLCERAR